jgi:hypothetical protein
VAGAAYDRRLNISSERLMRVATVSRYSPRRRMLQSFRITVIFYALVTRDIDCAYEFVCTSAISSVTVLAALA